MAFCGNCGAQVSGAFCPSCGKAAGAQSGPAAAPAQAQYAAAGTPVAGAGMAENVASLLCYILGFITGIVFLAMAPYNQNKTIRFHAFQSIFLSVAWVAVIIAEQIVNAVLLSISFGLFAIVATLWMLIAICFLVLWVVLMVKAYNGQMFKLPVIGALAEKQA
jgi:uncharacterized membrane protein